MFLNMKFLKSSESFKFENNDPRLTAEHTYAFVSNTGVFNGKINLFLRFFIRLHRCFMIRSFNRSFVVQI